MGYIRHEAVIAILFESDEPENEELENLRKEMDSDDDVCYGPSGWCILGPAKGVNGYTTWVFAPDGSKEGWDYSDKMDAYRERFLSIVKNSRYANVVHLQFGGDDRETKVLFTTDNTVDKD